MKGVFHATAGTDNDVLEALGRHTPLSPFNTRAYAVAASRVNLTPVSLYTSDETGIVDGCLGLLTAGVAARRLELPSIGRLQDPDTFWQGVAGFCASRHVTDLVVETFASDAASLPDYPRRFNHRPRREYIIDLDDGFEGRLAKDHKYNIRKAVRNGIRLVRTNEPGACELHLGLMHASTKRRRVRGEAVDAPGDGSLHAAILDAGAGELLQACDGDRVLSSILVLRGESGAYYHSGGTRPEGMKSGASQFLLFEAARRLADENFAVFNLGGADAEAEGLRNFKLRFGAREVPLEAAAYFMVPGYRRAASKLVRRLGSVTRALSHRAR